MAIDQKPQPLVQLLAALDAEGIRFMLAGMSDCKPPRGSGGNDRRGHLDRAAFAPIPARHQRVTKPQRNAADEAYGGPVLPLTPHFTFCTFRF
jgi:hypothetical protein